MGKSALGEDLRADAHRNIALVAQDVGALGSGQRGDPVHALLGGQTDEEVQVERLGDFVGEDPAERAVLGIHAAHEFALVKAEGNGVVAVSGARPPCRPLGRENRCQTVEIGDLW